MAESFFYYYYFLLKQIYGEVLRILAGLLTPVVQTSVPLGLLITILNICASVA